MNKIKGYIKSVLSEKYISMVDVNVKSILIRLLLLETPENVNYLKEGVEVSLIFNPSAVKISKDKPESISITNVLEGYILTIKKGKILSEITVDFKGDTIKSYITNLSSERMLLEVGEKVYLLIDATDIMLEV
ncbi:MAG: TOBE domain-containing protein [Hydrogenothermaceae bacterium]|nr:TOBE domain-containing protein [Hydrogenothermaceae bacterium]